MKKTSAIILTLTILVSGCTMLSSCSSYESSIMQIKDLQTKLMNETDANKRESIKARYTDMVGRTREGVVMTTLVGDVIEANQAYQDMLGYTLPELSNVTYQQITPEKWHEMEALMVAQAMEKDYVHFEKEYIKKDGTIFPIDITGWVIKDSGGNPVGTGAIVKPITR